MKIILEVLISSKCNFLPARKKRVADTAVSHKMKGTDYFFFYCVYPQIFLITSPNCNN